MLLTKQQPQAAGEGFGVTKEQERLDRIRDVETYTVLLCIMHSHVFGPNFQEKIFHFNILIQVFIYLYIETKLIMVFQGIILYMDIIVAF